MDILVVGGGGREHAIIRTLKKSPRCGKLYCTPGNGGIACDAECFSVAATDIDGVVALAKKLAVVQSPFRYLSAHPPSKP